MDDRVESPVSERIDANVVHRHSGLIALAHLEPIAQAVRNGTWPR
jgi:hypothetical protein